MKIPADRAAGIQGSQREDYRHLCLGKGKRLSDQSWHCHLYRFHTHVVPVEFRSLRLFRGYVTDLRFSARKMDCSLLCSYWSGILADSSGFDRRYLRQKWWSPAVRVLFRHLQHHFQRRHVCVYGNLEFHWLRRTKRLCPDDLFLLYIPVPPHRPPSRKKPAAGVGLTDSPVPDCRGLGCQRFLVYHIGLPYRLKGRQLCRRSFLPFYSVFYWPPHFFFSRPQALEGQKSGKSCCGGSCSCCSGCSAYSKK